MIAACKENLQCLSEYKGNFLKRIKKKPCTVESVAINQSWRRTDQCNGGEATLTIARQAASLNASLNYLEAESCVGSDLDKS